MAMFEWELVSLQLKQSVAATGYVKEFNTLMAYFSMFTLCEKVCQ